MARKKKAAGTPTTLDQLHEAAFNGDSIGVKLALRKLPDDASRREAVNTEGGPADVVPAIAAAMAGATAVVLLLIKTGTEVASVTAGADEAKSEGAEGAEPVKAASFLHRLAVVRCPLLDPAPVVAACVAAGASVTAVDAAGATPLAYAAQFGSAAMVHALVEAGAVVTATDDEGDTPLHCAVFSKNLATIRALVDEGASWDTPNRAGKTPAQARAETTKTLPVFDPDGFQLLPRTEAAAASQSEEKASWNGITESEWASLTDADVVVLMFVVPVPGQDAMELEDLHVSVTEQAGDFACGMVLVASETDPAVIWEGREVWFQRKHVLRQEALPGMSDDEDAEGDEDGDDDDEAQGDDADDAEGHDDDDGTDETKAA